MSKDNKISIFFNTEKRELEFTVISELKNKSESFIIGDLLKDVNNNYTTVLDNDHLIAIIQKLVGYNYAKQCF